MIGLTGDSDEIKKVARAYRVYYMKTAEEDSDYLVDHSIVMYVLASSCFLWFVSEIFPRNYLIFILSAELHHVNQRLFLLIMVFLYYAGT